MASIFEKYQDLLDANDFYVRNSMQGMKQANISDPEMQTIFDSDDLAKMNATPADAEDGPRPVPKDPEMQEIHFHRFNARREHKYTDQEMEQIRESCKGTIVHDYSEHDIFHQTDEEREANDMLSSIRMKLQGLRSMYNKVDQYIEAMRVVVEACEMIEKKANFIHSSDEFFQMIADGHIYISGVPMPHLRKMNKYNKDLLIKYISNPELDPEDLMFDKANDDLQDDYFYSDDDETEEEKLYRLLSEDDCKYIEEYDENPDKIKVKTINHKYMKDFYKRKLYSSGKKYKHDGPIRETLKSLLNKIQTDPRVNNSNGFTYSWMVANDIFEDEDTGKDVWDKLYYDGSWEDEDQLFLYDLAVKNELADDRAIGETYDTVADVQLTKFFAAMDTAGMNTIPLRRAMSMTEDDVNKVKTKKQRKDNKKVESALLQRITKLNNNPKFKKLVSKAEKEINKQANE